MKNQAILLTTLLGVGLLAVPTRLTAAALPKLKVSNNRRLLVTETGQPFFWLGDTAWELFHRLNREEAARYLKNRAERGYTVVQGGAPFKAA